MTERDGSNREFLVAVDIDTGGLAQADVDDLRRLEARRARALAESGNLKALWRVPGRWANYGIWSAPDEQTLAALLDTLPMRPYMEVRVEPLDVHPNDPRRADA